MKLKRICSVNIVTLLAVLILSACKENFNASDETNENYYPLGEELDSGVIDKIVVDEKTGVEYILVEYDGGITPRIDRNGKPIINKQWLKKHNRNLRKNSKTSD